MWVRMTGCLEWSMAQEDCFFPTSSAGWRGSELDVSARTRGRPGLELFSKWCH